MKKKILIMALAITLLMSSFAFASQLSENVTRIYNNIKIVVNGVETICNDITGKVIEPFVIDGTTYLPIRGISEALGLNVNWDNTTKTVTLSTPSEDVQSDDTEYNIVRVATVKDFLENIKPNTEIILTSEYYNLSNFIIQTNDLDFNDYILFEDNSIDGYEVIIHNIQNLRIVADKNVKPEIVIEPRYSNVLTFKECQNVTLSGIIAGHTPDKGYCAGGVINIDNSKDININNCYLYGCGTYGIKASSYGFISENINVNNTVIYDCSYGGIEFRDVKGAKFNNCIFRDNEEFNIIDLYSCNDIEFNNCIFNDNLGSEYFSFISVSESSPVVFKNCEFFHNKYKEFCNSNYVKFIDCKLQSKSY